LSRGGKRWIWIQIAQALALADASEETAVWREPGFYR
jgi:hypothetical protein